MMGDIENDDDEDVERHLDAPQGHCESHPLQTLVQLFRLQARMIMSVRPLGHESSKLRTFPLFIVNFIIIPSLLGARVFHY